MSGIADLTAAVDTYWLLSTGPIVFFMQMGFLTLEAGSVRVKNTKNILLKNTIDVCVTILLWWAVAFPFAFGGQFDNDDDENPVIGHQYFFSIDFDEYAFFFFQWTFANTSVTIISGAVAERIRFEAWLIVSAWTVCFVYPLPAHWVFFKQGWLSDDLHVQDFAGSGVVHLVGGAAALAGALIIGPREGRFVDGRPIEIPGHSIALMVLGVLTLWFCWFAFNAGSTLGLSGEGFNIASLVVANTLMAPVSAGLVTLAYHKFRFREFNVTKIFNSILAGLVASSAPCASVEPEDAVVIGVIAAIFYEACSQAVLYFKIDDVLDAFAVHGGGGLWGVLAVGLFAHQDLLFRVRGDHENDFGLLRGGGWYQFGVQALEATVLSAWGFGLSAAVFGILRLLKILRVSKYEEEKGLDETSHAGYAYTNIQIKVSDYVSVRRDVFV